MTNTVTAPEGTRITSVEYDSEKIIYVLEPTQEDQPLPEPFTVRRPTNQAEAFKVAHQIANRYNNNELSWKKEKAFIFKGSDRLLTYSTAVHDVFTLDPKFKRLYLAEHALQTFPEVFNMLYNE